MCGIPAVLFSQANLKFIAHLYNNNLHTEQQVYLNKLTEKTSSDSLHYLWAKFYLSENNIAACVNHFTASAALFKKDTAALNLICSQLLRHPQSGKTIFDHFSDTFFSSHYAALSKRVFEAANVPLNTTFTINDPGLQSEFNTYLRFSRKRPFVGGLLSAVIPGLGKLYAGRRQSFVNVFFAHTLYGITIYESIKKAGIKNPYTILNLSYCGVFYLSNIYGSFLAVKKVKEEKRKQFLMNASRYLDHNSNSRLYPDL